MVENQQFNYTADLAASLLASWPALLHTELPLSFLYSLKLGPSFFKCTFLILF